MELHDLKIEIQKALNQVEIDYLKEPIARFAGIGVSKQPSGYQVTLNLPFLINLTNPSLKNKVESAIFACFKNNSILEPITIEFKNNIKHKKVQAELKPKSNIKNIIAVASGKGGVGKSTVSVNLALSLKELGAKVGLVDADVYGPSLPTIFKDHSQPELKDNRFTPLEFAGLKVNSMGFLVGGDTAVMWRGPMISKVFDQLINETDWGELDFLVIDLPPGTGDIQLSMVQNIPLAGLVIVTTPQDVALADVFRSVQMFKKLKVNLLGVIENMAMYTCSNCGHQEPIFGQSRAKEIASRFEIPLIQSLPLNPKISQAMDLGQFKERSYQDFDFSQSYLEIAHKITLQLALSDDDEKHKFPDISLK